jgi:selenocysteine lyase/cysteine desulfurase
MYAASPTPRTLTSPSPHSVGGPKRPLGDLAAACTQRLPGTTADGLVVPTLHGPRTYANLDHAASTPALTVVAEAVERALRTYSSVHRGNGFASRVTSAFYEQARAEVAAFVGARAEDHVIFTRTTTDSWNLLSRALPEGTKVVVFASEHHSTLLPWGAERTVTLPVPRSVEAGLADLDATLAQVTADAPQTLVVVAGASNVTGEVWPVQALVAVTRRHGARLALDAAQLAPHRGVDLAATGVDYVAFSGHKLYAPYGAGVLAGRADWLDAAEPYLVGGGATARVTRDGVIWATGPARHEGGSPNVIGAVALAAACAVLAEHRDDLARWEHHLAERLRRGLEAIPGVRLHSLFGTDSDRVGVVAFTSTGSTPRWCPPPCPSNTASGCATASSARTRSSTPARRWRTRATPSTAVRASLGLASRPEHVERLVSAVAGLAAYGPTLSYARGPQGWEPDHDPRVVDLPRPW